METIRSIFLTLNPNAVDHYGYNPLHWACQNNDLNRVSWLVKTFDVNKPTSPKHGSKFTPLDLACAHGKSRQMIELLLKNGASVNAMNESGNSPLFRLCEIDVPDKQRVIMPLSTPELMMTVNMLTNPEPEKPIGQIAKMLLDQMISLPVNNERVTPLHVACRAGRVDAIQAILQKFPDAINFEDKQGRTPLFWACSIDYSPNTSFNRNNENVNVIQFLLTVPGIDVNKANNQGETPLWIAVRWNFNTSVVLLVNDDRIQVDKPNADGISPIFLAFQLQYTDMAKELLKKCDVNQLGRAMKFESELGTLAHYIAYTGYYLSMEVLLETPGIDVNLGSNGRSPLCKAIWMGHAHLVERLLGHQSIDINKPDPENKTPLQIACRMNGKNTETIKDLSIIGQLLVKGAHIDDDVKGHKLVVKFLESKEKGIEFQVPKYE
jgi:ankyrin repeat protein